MKESRKSALKNRYPMYYCINKHPSGAETSLCKAGRYQKYCDEGDITGYFLLTKQHSLNVSQPC